MDCGGLSMRSYPEDLHLPPQENCTAEYARLAKDVKKLQQKQLEEWYKECRYGYDQIIDIENIQQCIDLLYDWIGLDETQSAFKLLQSAEEYQRIKDCIKDIIKYLEDNKDIDLSSKQLKVKEFLWSK